MKDEKFKDEILIATNRKAKFNYFLTDFQECGIELVGSEIKALRSCFLSMNSLSKNTSTPTWRKTTTS